jgi:hypothetical protein
VAAGSMLAGLCEELLAEMAEHRATAQLVGLEKKEGRPTEYAENTEGEKV